MEVGPIPGRGRPPIPAGTDARRPCCPGITLLELLITVSIAAILLSWAAPGFIELYHRNMLVARTNALLADLVATRSEAIKRNLPVVICRSADGVRCRRGGGRVTDWSSGWIVFPDRDGDRDRDPDEPLLRVATDRAPRVSVVFNQWWRITFKPSGRAGTGSFTLCDRNGNARRLVVYLSGRCRLQQPAPAEARALCASS